MILTLIRWRERLSALDHGKCFLVEGCVAGARNNVTRNHLALPINLEGYLCKTGLPSHHRFAWVLLVYCEPSHEDPLKILVGGDGVTLSLVGNCTVGHCPGVTGIDP
jgi:hypothetical protein